MGFGLQVFCFQHVFAEDYDYLAGGYSSTMVTVICAVCIVYIWSLSPALPFFKVLICLFAIFGRQVLLLTFSDYMLQTES